MSKNVVIVLLGLLVALVLAIAGCGGGGGGSSVDSTPAISNLRYSPLSAAVNQGGGAITVTGSYDFIDNGADLTGGSVTIKGYDQNNNLTSNTSTPLTGTLAGVTSGTFSGPSTVNTTVAGTFRFVLFITDGNGNKSNDLTGSFIVR